MLILNRVKEMQAGSGEGRRGVDFYFFICFIVFIFLFFLIQNPIVSLVFIGFFRFCFEITQKSIAILMHNLVKTL